MLARGSLKWSVLHQVVELRSRPVIGDGLHRALLEHACERAAAEPALRIVGYRAQRGRVIKVGLRGLQGLRNRDRRQGQGTERPAENVVVLHMRPGGGGKSDIGAAVAVQV